MLRKVEKYEILEEIGHGGMATVYRARDTRLDRLVAFKVMHPHLRGAREARIRFAREARSAARLRHENIPEVYDYSGEDSDESYIAAELLTGPTLKQFAESHPDIPAEIAAAFAIQIARALGAAHESGVVHRDVKPENVLIHENTCVKLTDFGIAQMVDAQTFTVTGQILGSPGHMAPEQIEGGECDARTDLFSLGTVLYFLAVGRLPFSGKNPHQVLKRIVEGEYPDPLRIRPTIGGELARIVVKSLARDPAQRYQSAREFEADLLAFIGRIGLTDPDELLASYLRDPAACSEQLRRRTVEALLERGRRAMANRDRLGALDDFNRVLALEPGQPVVLGLIERMGQDGRRRVWLVAGMIAALLLGIGAASYAMLTPARVPKVVSVPKRVHRPARDENGVFRAPQSERETARTFVPPSESTTTPGKRPATRGNRGRPEREPPAPVPTGPRTVIFQPTPQNIAIGVDGAPPKPFGPSFQKVELEPGPHRFQFIGAANCCVDETVTVDVPAGEGPFTIERTLKYRPAYLYVVSNVPADVRIEGGVTGRTREMLRVPLESGSVELRRITVAAPAHREYTGTVRLTAGDDTQIDVKLEPVRGAP